MDIIAAKMSMSRYYVNILELLGVVLYIRSMLGYRIEWCMHTKNQ